MGGGISAGRRVGQSHDSAGPSLNLVPTTETRASNSPARPPILLIWLQFRRPYCNPDGCREAAHFTSTTTRALHRVCLTHYRSDFATGGV